MNLLDLMVKIGVDDEASSKIAGIAGSMKSGLATAAKAGAAAVAAVGAATVAIGKQALDAYADYEQLAGGIKKLYGEDAAQQMMQYADQAYKTVGVSANSYMQSVTAFSAAMLNSVGGDAQAAAALADQAMQDIADNANTFGVYTVEELTGVYQALAKGQYQMLDNLNLGFAGTKEGLQNLLNKAEELSGVHYDIGNFSDITQAIHVVQESMNITGTTANEAATTITGSITMTKAAWQNLLAELGKDDGNVGLRVQQLVESAKTMLLGSIDEATGEVQGGILPRVRTILQNISDTLPEILPKLQTAISEIVQELVPIIVELTPILVDAALTLFLALLEGLAKASPQIVEGLIQLVMKLIELIPKYMPQILNATVTLLGGIIQGIVQGIAPAMTKMNELGEGLLQSIGNFFGSMFNAGVQLINSIIEGFWATGDSMSSFFSSLLDGAYQTVVNFVGSFYNAGLSILNGLVQGIWDGFSNAANAVSEGLSWIRSFLPFSPAKRGPFSGKGWTLYSGRSMMEGLAEGIEQTASKAENAMGSVMTDVYDAMGGEVSIGMNASASSAQGSILDELKAMREDIRNLKLAVNMDGKTTASILYPYIDERMYQEAVRAGAL